MNVVSFLRRRRGRGVEHVQIADGRRRRQHERERLARRRRLCTTITSLLPVVTASTVPLAASMRLRLALPCSPATMRMERPSRLHTGPLGQLTARRALIAADAAVDVEVVVGREVARCAGSKVRHPQVRLRVRALRTCRPACRRRRRACRRARARRRRSCRRCWRRGVGSPPCFRDRVEIAVARRSSTARAADPRRRELGSRRATTVSWLRRTRRTSARRCGLLAGASPAPPRSRCARADRDRRIRSAGTPLARYTASVITRTSVSRGLSAAGFCAAATSAGRAVDENAIVCRRAPTPGCRRRAACR